MHNPNSRKTTLLLKRFVNSMGIISGDGGGVGGGWLHGGGGWWVLPPYVATHARSGRVSDDSIAATVVLCLWQLRKESRDFGGSVGVLQTSLLRENGKPLSPGQSHSRRIKVFVFPLCFYMCMTRNSTFRSSLRNGGERPPSRGV